MSALEPRIEAIRKEYDLRDDDFWELQQKRGTWLAKHSALEAVALKAGVEFLPPQIVEADGANAIAAMVVTGRSKDGREEWSVGEASPKNNKNAYPWSMAEKRGKDRVILKLVGLHGLVYSEDEFDEAPRPAAPTQGPAPKAAAKPKAESRDDYSELETAIRAANNMGELQQAWARVNAAKLPEDWRRDLIREKDVRKEELSPPKPVTDPKDNLDRLLDETAAAAE